MARTLTGILVEGTHAVSPIIALFLVRHLGGKNTEKQEVRRYSKNKTMGYDRERQEPT